MRRQKGFTIIELAVVVLVIGLLAFIGVRVWGTYTSRELANSSNNTPTTSKIGSYEELASVEKQLDDTDLVGSFEAELDNEASF